MIAIVKPDYPGDIVLSSPAIRAMAAHNKDAVLFVAGRCLDLAGWLFPGVELRPLDLPHLTGQAGPNTLVPDFTEFEGVALLRRDAVLTSNWASLRMPSFSMVEARSDLHVSTLDYGVAREFAPRYDIDALFYVGRGDAVAAKAATVPAHVGLSIGSDIFASSWPLVYWTALGRALRARGCEVTIIYGRSETEMAAILAAKVDGAKCFSSNTSSSIFFDGIATLDLVVASDGGTAHLCSTSVPVLSIFGPSSVRKCAPIGRWNHMMTQLLPCSPCSQDHEGLINGCLTTECMGEIRPADVLTAMDLRSISGEAGTSSRLRPGLTLIEAPSWLGRDAAIHMQEAERHFWHPEDCDDD